MSASTPGWYLDPDHRLRHRYWDGERWQSQCERLGSRPGRPAGEQHARGECPEDRALAP